MVGHLTVFVLVMLAYAVAAVAAGHNVGDLELDSVLSISSAVAASAVLLADSTRRPAVAAGVFVGQVAVSLQLDAGLVAAVWTGLAHTIEPLLGAAVVFVVTRRLDLTQPRHLLAFLAGPVTLGPLVGALVAIAPRLGEVALVPTVAAWWLSHGLGVLVLGALVVAFVAPEGTRLRPLDLVTSLTIVVITSVALFEVVDIPVGFLSFIPVATLSVRYGIRVATACSAAMAVVALGTALGYDASIAGLSPGGSRVTVQLQIVAVALAALSITAETSQRERTSRETTNHLETVRLLRSALTPERIVQGAHVEAEGVSTSASERLEVGGDWFHVAETAEGLVHILIGDVTGHGAEAVVPMGQLKFAASAFTTLTSNPAQLLDWLDAYAGHPETRIYATAFCAVYDPRHRRLTYASAGHPPALIGRPGEDWKWLGGARSPLLGLGRRGARRAEVVEVDGPFTLVAYTDGVVERPGEAIDIGLDRLLDTVARYADRPMSEFVARLHDDDGRDDASALRVRLSP